MSYDVAIAGAGIMGAATACELAREGAKVLLVEQAQIPNPRAASIDHSKIFRFAYSDPVYVRMAVAALALWRELEAQACDSFLTPTGLLLTGHNQPSFETEAFETLSSLGCEADVLSSREATARFPQFNAAAFAYAVFDPSGAILHAERAVRSLIALARRRGVEVVEGEPVAAIERGERGRARAIITESGRAFGCGQAVIACGPWTRKLLPALAGKLATTRQEVAYFEPLEKKSAPGSRDLKRDLKADFDVGRFPIFADLDSGFYGFPVHHAGAMKIANHHKGEPADPRLIDERVGDGFIDACRAFFAEFIPALADARLQQTRVCIYNNTPDDDFIIDWHPEFENVLIVTGFSGHGFKFGSVVARIASELLLSGRASYDVTRFSLARFGNEAS